MSSVLTNASATSALRVLATTQRSLAATEKAMATGLRVSEASDNEAYWAIGATMRSQVGAVGAVQDALKLTQSIADVAAAALSSVLGNVQAMMKDAVTAATPGTDRAAVQADVANRQAAILSAVNAASFNGVNWLTMQSSGDTYTSYFRVYGVTAAQSASGFTGSAPYAEGFSYGDNGTGYIASATQRYTETYAGPGKVDLTPEGQEAASQGYLFSSGASYWLPTSYGSGGLAGTAVDARDLALLNDNAGTKYLQQIVSFGTGPTTTTLTATGTVGRSGILADPLSRIADTAGNPMSVLTLDVTRLDDHNLGLLASSLGRVVGAIESAAAHIGSIKTEAGIQLGFNAALTDALQSGIGSLVDADMNTTATRLQALETQQQLGVQALSIANDRSKSILMLFNAAGA